MSLHQIVYCSVASNPLSEDELRAMLLEWRAKNQARHITGILLYSHGQILQVLEGEESTLRALYHLIEHDPRHRDVATLADGPATHRAFADWTMGFSVVDPHELRGLVGYTDPTRPNFPLPRAHNAGPELLALLQEFVALQEVEV